MHGIKENCTFCQHTLKNDYIFFQIMDEKVQFLNVYIIYTEGVPNYIKGSTLRKHYLFSSIN